MPRFHTEACLATCSCRTKTPCDPDTCPCSQRPPLPPDPDRVTRGGWLLALSKAADFIGGLSQYDNKLLPKRAFEEARGTLEVVRAAQVNLLSLLAELKDRGARIKELEAEVVTWRDGDPRTLANPRLMADAMLGHELVNLLMTVCGDGGTSEGAVECLERILRERAELKRVVTTEACRTGASYCNMCGGLVGKWLDGGASCQDCGHKPVASRKPGTKVAVARLKAPSPNQHTLYIHGGAGGAREDNMYASVFGEGETEPAKAPGALVPVRANLPAPKEPCWADGVGEESMVQGCMCKHLRVSHFDEGKGMCAVSGCGCARFARQPAIRTADGKIIPLENVGPSGKPITLRLHNPVIERSQDWGPNKITQPVIRLFDGPRALWKPDLRYVDKYGLAYITLHGFRCYVNGGGAPSAASAILRVRDAAGRTISEMPAYDEWPLPIPVVIGGPGEAADWSFEFERGDFELKSLSVVIDIEQAYVSL